LWSRDGQDLGADMSDFRGSTPTAQSTGSTSGTLLGLVVASSDDGSGVDEFLAQLATLVGQMLSGPERAVTCEVTVTRRRRPPLASGSVPEGAASSLRLPLFLDEENTAVVSLCSPRPEAFSDEDVAEARQLAAEASPALLLALRISKLSESRDDLAAAMQSRTIIDMAIGAIMAQNRCPRDAAFKILRNTSNNRNMKIRDVAATLIGSIAGDTDTSARFDD
jgi:hypothetical protein